MAKWKIPDSLTAQFVKDWWFNFHIFEDHESLYTDEIESIYLIGSRAKGTHRPNSDVDIAVVFPSSSRFGVSSLTLSSGLHQIRGFDMPYVGDLLVDFQIFFADDPDFSDYTKIEIK